MNNIFLRAAAVLLVLVFPASFALAHHSFAVFFDADKSVSVSGTVVDFQFRNPHGLIRIRFVDGAGKEQVWKAETNSPSILERRGWARDTIKPGETITLEGWPARDGSHYLRLRAAKRADGTLIGRPLAASDEQ